MDHEHGEGVELYEVGFAIRIGFQRNCFVDDLAIQLHGHARRRAEDRLAVVKFEDAEFSWAAWQNNLTAGFRPRPVDTISEPEQSRHRQPAVVSFELGFQL